MKRISLAFCFVLQAALGLARSAITLNYTDPWDNLVKPLAGAQILLYNSVGQLKWTSAPSNSSGQVSFAGVVPNKLDYGAIGYLAVSASTSDIRIIQHQSCFTEVVAYVLGLNPSLYPVAVKTTGNDFDGRTINVGDGYIPTILSMGTLARNVAVSKFGISPSRLDVYWDPCLYSGTGWPHFLGIGGDFWTEIGSYFTGTNLTMRKSDLETRPRAWAQDMITHEYGHYVQFLLNGSQSLPGGGGDHTFFTRGDAGLAFSEGWAEFYSEYTLAKNGLPFYGSNTYRRETFPQLNGSSRGTDNEGHVAAFFWDLFDNDVPNSGDETTNGDWSRAQTVFGSHPSNIQAFRNSWMNLWYDDDAFDDLFKKTFFYGFPGYAGPVPAKTMKFIPAQPSGQGTMLTREFMISDAEVTQGEFYDIMKIIPFKNYLAADPSLPAEMVTWYDAVLYCNALSLKEGRQPVYTYTSASYGGLHCSYLSGLQVDLSKNGYRLPTREEWTWAYKAGTTTPFYWGSASADNYAWYSSNSSNTTHPIRTKLPNNWGLYDMGGNVMEWIWDGMPAYNAYTAYAMGGGYSSGTTSGCKIDNSSTCTSDPYFMNPFAGFRIARTTRLISPEISLLME